MSSWSREGKYRRVSSAPVGDSKTRQSEAAACDIKNILKGYKKTGVINHLNRASPVEGDFSVSADLHSAIMLVDAANEEFEALPSEVRKAAEHNPVRLLHMLADEGERRELMVAGLDPEWVPPVESPVEEPVAAPVVAAAAAETP